MLLLFSMHSRAKEDGFMGSSVPQKNHVLERHQFIQSVKVTCLFTVAAQLSTL